MYGLILKNKNFLKLFIANASSKFGDSMHELVFIILAIDLSRGNPAFIGILYFFRFIPYLLFGFFGGYLADNFNNKNIMLIADLARVIITILLFILTYSGFINLFLLGLAGFSMTFFRIVFQPCFQASVFDAVEKNTLVTCNSIMQISEEAGTIIGPAFAGLLMIFIDKSTIFLIDSFTFLISFLSIACLCKTGIHRIVTVTSRPFLCRDLILNIFQSVKCIAKDNKLSITIFISGFCIFLVSSTIRFILPIYLKNNFPDNAAIIGLTLSSIACGAVFGAILYNKLWKTCSLDRLLLLWSAYGIFILIITFTHSQACIILIAFIIGIIGSWVDINIVTSIQLLSSGDTIGRNFSIFSTIANTGEASSGLVSGFFIKLTSLLFCSNLFSCLIIVTPLIIFFAINSHKKLAR